MLYLIGLGLNAQGISKQGMLTIEKCKKVYVEVLKDGTKTEHYCCERNGCTKQQYRHDVIINWFYTLLPAFLIAGNTKLSAVLV